MKLTGKSQVVGIFGDPIAHSLSPRMQNAAIAAAGLDAIYVPFHVTPGQLCDAVAGIRAMEIRGVNLTIPHKETSCALVDELDEGAAVIGAINTIVNRGGRLIGYNTDVQGLINAIKLELGMDVADKRVLVIGAGGACRAALVALAGAGTAWVGVANRTRERARRLVDEMSPSFPGTSFAHYSLGSELLSNCQPPVDLLINATSVGLKGESFDFPVVDCVASGGAVSDMIYSPEPTALLRDARARGLVAMDGQAMLAAQGEVSFELWFGVRPRQGLMRQSLQE